MADFVHNRMVVFQGSIGGGPSFQWTAKMDLANAGTIRDAPGAGAGVLTTHDSFTGTPTITSGSYTGHYIPITHNGTTYNFGVFTTNNGLWDYCIPYNTALLPFSLFDLVPASGNGTLSAYDLTLESAANCFLTGTRIATPHGPRAIEALGRGDLILTADGRAIPIIWVWRQEILNLQGLSEDRTPILISANALGEGRPARDLVVTADHAMALGGCLINAGTLVNDITIRRLGTAQMPARFRYWHIETAAHEVLLAENCPTESYIPYAPRQVFDNYDAYLAHYGSDLPIAEMDLPRISAARMVPQVLRPCLSHRALA